MASEPTRGPVEVASFREHLRVQALDDDRTYICAFESPSCHPFVNREANANFIAAAFDASTAARDLGFDAIGAIEALPLLIEACRKANSCASLPDAVKQLCREAVSAARKRGDA